MAVLEARDRVGGRTLNHPVGRGEVVEVGGEWVGPGQDRIMARARALGISTFKTYTKGELILDYDGRQTRFSGLIPPLPEPDASDFAVAARQARRPAVDDPARPRRGRRPTRPTLDAQTLETFKLANTTTAGARFLLDLATKAVFAAEPRDLSLLHALFYMQLRARDHQPDRHRGRRPGLAARRRLTAGLDPDGRAARQAAWCSTRRCGGSRRSRGGVVVDSDAGVWRAQAGDRRAWPRRSPGGSTTSRRCRRCATS